MIIYIEGVDGSGKTTLADKIAKMCEKEKIEYDRYAERAISTKPDSVNRITFEELVKKFEFMANDYVLHILDRGPISDCIYRMFDEYEPVGKLQDYISLFEKCKGNLIIIYARTKKAEEMMHKRGDDNPVAIALHRELSKSYDLVMGVINNYLTSQIILFDFSKRNATNYIVECSKSYAKHTQWYNKGKKSIEKLNKEVK